MAMEKTFAVSRGMPPQVTLTLTQDQAEHVLLCARMALAQAQAAALEARSRPLDDLARRRMKERCGMFAGLVLALEAQITER